MVTDKKYIEIPIHVGLCQGGYQQGCSGGCCCLKLKFPESRAVSVSIQ